MGNRKRAKGSPFGTEHQTPLNGSKFRVQHRNRLRTVGKTIQKRSLSRVYFCS